MVAVVVGKSRLRQEASRWSKAGDPPDGELMPADVERRELWKELQLAIGQMIVYPPGHRLPGGAVLQAIDQPGNDDRRHGAHAAIGAALIPDVAPAVPLVRSAAAVMLAAVRVHLRGPVCRTHTDS